MTWLEYWRDLAARIDGLIRAGEFLVSAFKVNSTDAHSVVRKSFQPELEAIIAEIERFGKTYASELPEQASTALGKYVTQGWNKSFNDGSIDIQKLASLASFRSQFEYLIRDTEAEGAFQGGTGPSESEEVMTPSHFQARLAETLGPAWFEEE